MRSQVIELQLRLNEWKGRAETAEESVHSLIQTLRMTRNYVTAGGSLEADIDKAIDKALKSIQKSKKRMEESAPKSETFAATHIFVLLDGTEVPVQVEVLGDPIAKEADGTRWCTVMGVESTHWTCMPRKVLRIQKVTPLNVPDVAPKKRSRKKP